MCLSVSVSRGACKTKQKSLPWFTSHSNSSFWTLMLLCNVAFSSMKLKMGERKRQLETQKRKRMRHYTCCCCYCLWLVVITTTTTTIFPIVNVTRMLVNIRKRRKRADDFGGHAKKVERFALNLTVTHCYQQFLLKNAVY